MADVHNLIVAVLVKYALRQPLSEAEARLLEEWRSRSDEHRDLPDQLRDPQWQEEHRRELEAAPSAEMWENIRRHIRAGRRSNKRAIIGQRRPRIRQKWLVAAVAGTLILMSAGFWYRWTINNAVVQTKKKEPALAAMTRKDDSSNQLMLGDGRVLNLDTARPGAILWMENNWTVMRTDSGIAYTAVITQAIKYAIHVLSIGRRISRPFRVDFPGGSKVWLTKGSRLDYSTGLRGGQDPVLDGEAWFDIAKDTFYHPLRVKTIRGEVVTALGTSFDVRSYSGEPQSRVELYSGKVRVRSKDDSLILNPGSAAVMAEGKGPEVRKMDRHQAMPAWMRPPAKSPYFEFQNASLSAALREVASWYLMDLSNPYGVKGIPITGKLPRSEPLENTLQALERVQSGHVYLRCRADTIVVVPGAPGP